MNRTHIIGWTWVAAQFVGLIALILLPRRSLEIVPGVIGGALIILAALLALYSFMALGPALTPTPVPLAEAGLRTHGIYRLIRHPIYSSIVLLMIGYVVAIGSWWSLLGASVMTVFFWAKSRWEDALLRETYGSSWEEWASKTGALVPGWGRYRREA